MGSVLSDSSWLTSPHSTLQQDTLEGNWSWSKTDKDQQRSDSEKSAEILNAGEHDKAKYGMDIYLPWLTVLFLMSQKDVECNTGVVYSGSRNEG